MHQSLSSHPQHPYKKGRHGFLVPITLVWAWMKPEGLLGLWATSLAKRELRKTQAPDSVKHPILWKPKSNRAGVWT